MTNLNTTIMGLRHRSTNTFYLSPLILGPQKEPTLLRLFIAQQVAAFEDALESAKVEGWDGSDTPKAKPDGPDKGGGGEGKGKSGGAGKGSGAGGKGGGTGRKGRSGGDNKGEGTSSSHQGSRYDVDGIVAPFPVSRVFFTFSFSPSLLG
jgi:hypothetical protein